MRCDHLRCGSIDHRRGLDIRSYSPVQPSSTSAGPRFKFWFALTRREERTLIPAPILVAIAYVTIFKLWHFLAFAFEVHSFFGFPGVFGLSLRSMDHMVNAVVLVYLVVSYLVLLLPHHHAARNERILVAIAVALVAAMHLAIP